VGQAASLRSVILIIRVTYRHGSPLQSAPDREYDWRGSMATALQTMQPGREDESTSVCDTTVWQRKRGVSFRVARG